MATTKHRHINQMTIGQSSGMTLDMFDNRNGGVIVMDDGDYAVGMTRSVMISSAAARAGTHRNMNW